MNRKHTVEQLQSRVYDILKDKQIKSFYLTVTDLTTEHHEAYCFDLRNYSGDPKYDGMQLLYEDGIYETCEYQAGTNNDELHIFLETPSLKRAITNLVKGNNRKPIKVW